MSSSLATAGLVACPDKPTVDFVMDLYPAYQQEKLREKVLGLTGREAALLNGSSAKEPNPENYGCALVAPGGLMLADPTIRVVGSVVAVLPDDTVVRGVVYSKMLLAPLHK